jgi:YD repeat-containing protein
MKKLMFLIAIFCILKANSQPYFITFAGTGASNTVSTVKVENLTAGTTLTLNGSDILRLTISTGVNSAEDIQSTVLKIYPNPMIDNAILEICPPVAGDALITVCEMTGKQVVQTQSYLDNGLQEFRFSGLNNGVYLIIVNGEGYQLSGKLLCNGKSNGTISLEKISNNQTTDGKIIKMDSKGELATVDMNYTPGDALKFTGISGNYSATVIDIPTSSKTITFSFTECALACNIGTQSYSIGITCESGTIITTYHGQSTEYQYDNNGKLIGIKINLNQTRTYVNTNNSYTIVGIIEINLNQNTETHNITVSGGKFQNPQTCS